MFTYAEREPPLIFLQTRLPKRLLFIEIDLKIHLVMHPILQSHKVTAIFIYVLKF